MPPLPELEALDAPVSGGPSGAKSGRLAIWVGGDKAVFDEHKDKLDAIGDQTAKDLDERFLAAKQHAASAV